jgi:hypothetical protein
MSTATLNKRARAALARSIGITPAARAALGLRLSAARSFPQALVVSLRVTPGTLADTLSALPDCTHTAIRDAYVSTTHSERIYFAVYLNADFEWACTRSYTTARVLNITLSCISTLIADEKYDMQVGLLYTQIFLEDSRSNINKSRKINHT